MTKKEKAQAILAYLEQLYPDPPIPLYHTNPFTMCIAVLLSAHTTDKSVNGATPTLFKLADNPADMVKLSPERIQEIIRRVGLSKTKSRNVWNLSRILLEKHGGRLPETMEELEELPGVGHKTASVVMCQAFGVPAFPVDTHIHRLAERWGLSNGKNVEQTEKDLKALFPKEKWPKLHLQMIYYGREYCPARNHDLTRCELCHRFGTREVKSAAAKKVVVDVAAKRASKAAATRTEGKGGKKKPTAGSRLIRGLPPS
ncbi:MAG: putative EndoIII-related endonuclease [Fibrobacteres bacterium]|nr:putative EndoIII-related endonuclease [Fibrobacterota bacterium]